MKTLLALLPYFALAVSVLVLAFIVSVERGWFIIYSDHTPKGDGRPHFKFDWPRLRAALKRNRK